MLKNRGFTIFELIVVIAIWALISTLLLANLAGLRGPRNLKIAENELVTNIRKAQSYAFTSRNAPSGQPARIYIVKFSSNAASYNIQAIDNQNLSNPGTPQAVETINLPAQIKITSLTATPAGGSASSPSCLQIGFGLPYGTVYLDKSCAIENTISNPVAASQALYYTAVIRLTDSASGTTKDVTVNGTSGTVLGN